MSFTPFKSLNSAPAHKPSANRPPADSFVEALKNTSDQGQYFQKLEEERRLHLEQQRVHERRRRQDFLVFSQKEQQRYREIEALQQQLIELLKDTQGLSQEVDVAIKQQLVDPGTYHVNFFHRLRQFIQLLRKKIQDSHTWLIVFNHRASQKGYWGQVQTSGTKFMLSHERYMVTQTG